MIIPWLKGFLNLSRAPLMWTLVALNVFVYGLTVDSYSDQDTTGQEFVSDNSNYEMTVRAYYQFKGHAGLPEKKQYVLLFKQAVQDPIFIKSFQTFNFQGDQIALNVWKQRFSDFEIAFRRRPSAIFGLTSFRVGFLSWITYQFTHAGVVHLLSNMLMLIIFAGALETLIGSFGVVLIYLLSGFAGVLGFLFLSDPTLIPMVGASGSLSGIMAFYAIYERKERVSFFYFLSPIQGFYGQIWLPRLMIFPLYFATDLAAYFGTAKEVGSGIAYTAHIGGMVFGLCAGYFTLKYKESVLRGLSLSNR
jgi:membrane associated rhomboid family serine protease